MINATIYIFGNLANGYTQLPYTNASGYFQRMVENCSSPTQLCIHREGPLIYYAYVRKLDIEQQYIGLCICVNDILFKETSALFPVMENVIDEMCRREEIIGFNHQGEMVAKAGNIYKQTDEVNAITQQLKEAVQSLKVIPLPPVAYGANSEVIKTFFENNNPNEVLYAITHSKYVFIYKNMGYDTPAIKQYKLDALKKAAETEYLESQSIELRRQEFRQQDKKSMRSTFLIVLIAFMLGYIFLLHKEISNLQENETPPVYTEVIDVTNDELDKKDFEIQELKAQNKQLYRDLKKARDTIKTNTEIIEQKDSIIQSLQPPGPTVIIPTHL